MGKRRKPGHEDFPFFPWNSDCLCSNEIGEDSAVSHGERIIEMKVLVLGIGGGEDVNRSIPSLPIEQK